MTVNKSVATIEFGLVVKLSEKEARALEAMVGYGFDSFKKVFYERLGEHYMKPHEDGLKSLFDTVKKEINPHLSRFNNTRATFNSKL